jgi:DNA repair protein RecN (Recombination protein N)
MQILDSFAGNASLLEEYSVGYATFSKNKKRLEALQSKEAERSKELDYLQFQVEELQQLQLEEGEENTLLLELKQLDNAEGIKLALLKLAETLDGSSEQTILSTLQEIKNTLGGIRSLSPQYETFYARLETSFIDLKELAREAAAEESTVEHDPTRIDEMNERISVIQKLKTKHSASSSDELIIIAHELEEKMSELQSELKDSTTLTQEVQEQEKKLMVIAQKLSQTRQEKTTALSEQLVRILSALGMPDSALEIELKQGTQLTSTGIDEVQFLFSANKGVAKEPIHKVASGGEFSRVMFALKYMLADHSAMPTIIFDEIDTGISGEIALKMGKLMTQMSKNHQMIVITHLPQIAGRGEQHFFVYKNSDTDKTTSELKELSPEDRVQSIAKMIGGESPSESAFESARELLKD